MIGSNFGFRIEQIQHGEWVFPLECWIEESGRRGYWDWKVIRYNTTRNSGTAEASYYDYEAFWEIDEVVNTYNEAMEMIGTQWIACNFCVLWYTIITVGKGVIVMQAYRARYECGRIVPLDTIDIPEGAQMIITVLDEPAEPLSHQSREVWREFFEAIRECNEEVPEFERVKFTREVDI